VKRVLIGHDGSPEGEGIFDDLARAGLGADVEVQVLTLADVWLPEDPGETAGHVPSADPACLRQSRERAEQMILRAQKAAAAAAENLRGRFPSWKIESQGCGDSPAWGILKWIVDWKADLVVLGSHGRSTLERFFLGSVSQKVAAEATCSVRITRPRLSAHRAAGRFLVAVDGSSDARNAVRVVAEREWPAGSEFRVVAVVDPKMESFLAWLGTFQQHRGTEPNETTEEAVTRLVEEDSRALSDQGLAVETRVVRGDAKKELLAQIQDWEADCIFMGARGAQHGGHLTLGTTASAVTARAHCSVEIIRPE
jgi:nucleotide-binding universal stress UspA family protein